MKTLMSHQSSCREFLKSSTAFAVVATEFSKVRLAKDDISAQQKEWLSEVS